MPEQTLTADAIIGLGVSDSAEGSSSISVIHSAPPELMGVFGSGFPAHETRNHPQTIKLYLAIEEPRIIWKARVTVPRGITEPFEDDQEIQANTADSVAPFDVNDFGVDLTLWIGSTEEAKNWGVCRVRGFSTNIWPAANCTVSVAADVSSSWPVGAYLTVVDMHELWPRPHTTEEVGEPPVLLVRKDVNLPYTDFVEGPVPIMGPPVCAFLDPDSGEVDVYFNSIHSYEVPPTTEEWHPPDPYGGIASRSWWFEGGDPEDSVAVSLYVTYDTAGQYVAKLSCTGVSGKTHTTYRRVFIFERIGANAPVTDFSVESCGGSMESGGWQAGLTLYGDSKVDVASNAMIVLFAEEEFAGVAKGGTTYGRGNIKMVGWVSESGISATSEGSQVRVSVEGLGMYMQRFTNFPVYFTQLDSDAPGWSYKAGLTTRQTMYHLIRWHWTLMTMTDVFLLNWDVDQYITGHDFPEGSPADQMSALVSDIQGEWSTDRDGALHIFQVPNIIPVAERNLWMSFLSVDTRDFTDVQIEMNRVRGASRVRVEGVSVDGVGLYSAHIATTPGGTLGFQGKLVTLGSQVLDDADHAESLSRLMYAWESRIISSITLTMAGNYGLFDVGMPERLQLTYDPSARGLAWVAKDMWILSIDEAYNVAQGEVQTTLQLVPDTYPDGLSAVDSWSIEHQGRGPADTPSRDFENGVVSIVEGPRRTPGYGNINPIKSLVDTRIPAQMGSPLASQIMAGPRVGTTYIRLRGQTTHTAVALNPGYKEIYDRPIWVEEIPRTTGYQGTGPDVKYRIVGVRPNEVEFDSSNSSTVAEALAQGRYLTYARGHMTVPGSLSVDTFVAPSLLVGPGSLFFRQSKAYVRTAPTGADLNITVYYTRSAVKTQLTTISIAAGANSGSSTVEYPPFELLEDDIIDIDITQVGSSVAGADLTVAILANEVGI